MRRGWRMRRSKRRRKRRSRRRNRKKVRSDWVQSREFSCETKSGNHQSESGICVCERKMAKWEWRKKLTANGKNLTANGKKSTAKDEINAKLQDNFVVTK